MDATLQRNDLVEIAQRAAQFSESLLRIRTDENRLIAFATGRTTPGEPVSKTVPDTLIPALIAASGAANGDPAELALRASALATQQVRLVAIAAWPGFEISEIDPAPASPPAPRAAVAAPPVDVSAHVAAFIDSGTFKLRRPWTVPLFGTLTLGIYLIVWYHRINRELRDLGALCGAPGRRLDVKPGRSTLAVSLFAVFIVPPFVSLNRTFRRVRRAEQITGAPVPHLSRETGWAIFLLVLPFWTVYVQRHLNGIWQSQLERVVVAAPEPVAEPAPAPVQAEPLPEPAAEAPTLIAEPAQPEPWPVPPADAVVPSFAPPAPRVVKLPPVQTPDPHDPAIEIVRARYARGEISREEYRALLDDLA